MYTKFSLLCVSVISAGNNARICLTDTSQAVRVKSPPSDSYNVSVNIGLLLKIFYWKAKANLKFFADVRREDCDTVFLEYYTTILQKGALSAKHAKVDVKTVADARGVDRNMVINHIFSNHYKYLLESLKQFYIDNGRKGARLFDGNIVLSKGTVKDDCALSESNILAKKWETFHSFIAEQVKRTLKVFTPENNIVDNAKALARQYSYKVQWKKLLSLIEGRNNTCKSEHAYVCTE